MKMQSEILIAPRLSSETKDAIHKASPELLFQGLKEFEASKVYRRGKGDSPVYVDIAR